MKPKLISLTNQPEPLLGGPPESASLKSGHQILKPGESCGRHSTKNREELILVRSGQGKVLIDHHNELLITAQNAVYIPTETWHDVMNTGTEILDYVYVVAPVTTDHLKK